MLTVTCPHCSTALKLRQAPPAGKVKCPKCSNVVPVPASAQPAGQKKAPASKPSQPLDPDDAAFDFGRINFPNASPTASSFPVAGQPMQVYDGPIPGDPLDSLPPEEGGPQPEIRTATGAKKKSSPLLAVGILAGLGVLVIGGIVAGVMLSGGGGGGEKKVDELAKLKANTPKGYQAIGHRGCATLLPAGPILDTKLSSVIGSECTAVESSASGSFFFFGAMDGGTSPLDEDQMKKKAGKQLGGDILGGSPTERNGYKGIEGKLDGSQFVQNMIVEIYHADGQFVILGCAPAGFEADPSEQMGVDIELVLAEQKKFHDSFRIGPAPSGWLF